MKKTFKIYEVTYCLNEEGEMVTTFSEMVFDKSVGVINSFKTKAFATTFMKKNKEVITEFGSYTIKELYARS